MHALDSLAGDSPGASPSLSERPSAAYGVNAIRDSAAWTESGGAGLPTAGSVTVASGPLDVAAVHAARPAQQMPVISTPAQVRMRIVVPFRLGSGMAQGRKRAGPRRAQRGV